MGFLDGVNRSTGGATPHHPQRTVGKDTVAAGMLAEAAGSTAPAWPRYDAATDPYLELDAAITSGAGLATTSCDALDAQIP